MWVGKGYALKLDDSPPSLPGSWSERGSKGTDHTLFLTKSPEAQHGEGFESDVNWRFKQNWAFNNLTKKYEMWEIGSVVESRN